MPEPNLTFYFIAEEVRNAQLLNIPVNFVVDFEGEGCVIVKKCSGEKRSTNGLQNEFAKIADKFHRVISNSFDIFDIDILVEKWSEGLF